MSVGVELKVKSSPDFEIISLPDVKKALIRASKIKTAKISKNFFVFILKIKNI